MVHCPSCGAGLRFEIETQQMYCDHCLGHFHPAELYDKLSDDAKTEKTFDSFVYVCPSCGGEIQTTDKNDAVGFCPYCGGASMIYDKIRKEWKPDFLIPFQVTKEQCKQLYCDEVKKHPFVSKKYRDAQLIESFRGIYMPYCEMGGTLSGTVKLRADSHEQNVGNYNYETRRYDVKGQAEFTVAGGASHDASVAFDDHLSERLEPFDKRSQRRFAPGYLCGFYAEAGDIEAGDYAMLAREDMKDALYTAMQSDPEMKKALNSKDLRLKKHDPEDSLPVEVNVGRRMLYPVWFMSYRRGNKITYATVNGQTGKVAADLPLSPLRILLAALGCAAVIFGLLFLASQFLPSIPARTTLGVSGLLGIIGMYDMQHSYINTVGTALNTPDIVHKNLPLWFVLSSVAALVGVVLMSTDGSYEQDRFALGAILTLAGTVVNLVQHFKQRRLTKSIKQIELNTRSMQTNGILAEAKRFNRINGIMRAVMYVSMLFSLLGSFAQTPNNTLLYTLAFIAGGELIALALLHIRFQTTVAMRRLPQFNKKGAAYDEN